MISLKNLYGHFANHPQGSWIISWAFAQILYSFIKEHPVKRVLDLGTGIGCSAAVISLSLKEKGEDYKIDSIEQFDKCARIATDLIPVDLKEKIMIYKCEARIWKTEKIPYQYFSIYEDIPDGNYDLIVNDGPAPWREEGHYLDFPNGTVTKLLLEEKIRPGTLIVWDKRIQAIGLLERYFGNNFYLIEAQKNVGFYALEKKKIPFHFEDIELKKMEGAGYFDDGKEKSDKK